MHHNEDLKRLAESEAPHPGDARPLVDSIDEDTEVIGSLLWAAFAAGAGDCKVGPAVIKLGRAKSRGWVRHNLEMHGFSNFPIDRTTKCARDCGVRAAAYSLPAMEVTIHAFETAWEEEQSRLLAASDRLKRINEHAGLSGDWRIKGGACS